eukprot:c2768_g1_i1 orf=330-863(+)
MGRNFEKTQVSLRFVAVLTAVAALALIVSDKEAKGFNIFPGVVVYHKATFTDLNALRVSVIVIGIAAGYSCLQSIRCVLGLFNYNTSKALPICWCFFLLDQAMSYLLLSSAAATAEASYLSEQANTHLGWGKVCNFFRAFCYQMGAGLVVEFILTMELAATAVLSAYLLFRRKAAAE